MTDSDDFCLGGTHLIPNGGESNNGKSGTVYHVPKASFMKIVSNGTQGNGPDSFTDWSKDGLTREFGATSDAQLQTGTTYNHTVMAWLLNKVSDHWGNFISYSYAKSQDDGDTPGADTSDQLTEIDYGNGSGLVVGKIVFSYQLSAPTAYHAIVTYTDGFHHVIQSELSSITVYSGGSKLWTYNLSYTLPTSGPARLASVDQCDAAGSCLKPETFQYASPSVGLLTGKYSLKEILANNLVNALHFGAFTDSGVSDALFSKNNNWYLNESVNPSIASGPAPGQALVFDANNDGHSDIVFPINYNQLELAEWKNGALAEQQLLSGYTYSYLSGDAGHMAAVDVVGNGFPWLFFVGASSSNGSEDWTIQYYKNSNGTFEGPFNTNYVVTTSTKLTPFRFRHGIESLYVGTQGCDMTNLSAPCASSVGILSWDQTSGNFQHANALWGGSVLRFVDLNGDGLDDVVQWDKGSNGEFFVYLNEGGQFGSPQYWTPAKGTAPSAGNFVSLDWNGDGLADLVWPSQDGYWHVISYEGTDGRAPVLDTSKTTLPDSGVLSLGVVSGFDATGHGGWDMLVSGSGHLMARLHTGSNSSNTLQDWPHDGSLTQITNALGASIKINYDAITGQRSGYRFYTANPKTPFPCHSCATGIDKGAIRPLTAPLFVVTSINAHENTQATITTQYHYYKAKIDTKGRGFLGFDRVTKTTLTCSGQSECQGSSAHVGGSVQTDYELGFPYTGMVLTQQLTDAQGKQETVTSNQFDSLTAATGGVFPYVNSSVTDAYESDGSTVDKSVTTTHDYDDWGDATSITVATNNPITSKTYTTTTNNTYTNTQNGWCLGRLTASNVTLSGPYGGAVTRNSSFTYSSCALATQTFEPNDSAVTWTKTFGFDAYGNHTSVKLTGAGIGTRKTTTIYDTNSRFVTATADALGNVTSYQNNVLGEVTQATGPNGSVMSASYDGFGRKSGTSGPYSNDTSSMTYGWCSGSNCSADTTINKPIYYATIVTAGASTTYVEYDDHGRAIYKTHTAFGDKSVASSAYYDALGRKYLASEPHFSTDAPCWVWNGYGPRGRVTETVSALNETECGGSAPGSASPPSGYSDIVNDSYTGLTTTVSQGGRTATKTMTVAGKMASRSNAAGDTMLYRYDGAGDLIRKTDPGGAVSTYSYDAAGHRTGMTSPSSGVWSYGYDALGELTTQTDPTGNVITQGYDAAGDLTSRMVKDSAGNTRTSTWIYGTSASAFNAGRIETVTNGNGYTKTYTYDKQGDPTGATTSVDGTSYTTNKVYDGYGRVTQITYPDSPAPPNQDHAPVAVASASPTQLTSAGTVTLNGSASYDPDHGPLPLTYRWKEVSGPVSVSISNASSAVAHVNLSVNGTYQFTLTVGDGDKTASKSVTVTVSIPAATTAITNISPNPSDTGSYTVTWNGVPNITGYNLDQSANGGSWSAAIEVTDPTSGGGGGPKLQPFIASASGSASPQTAPATASTWRMVIHYAYDSLGEITSVYGPDATSPYWTLESMDAAGHVTGADEAGTADTLTHIYDRATGQLTWTQAKHGGALVLDEQYKYDAWGERTQRLDGFHTETEKYIYSAASRLTKATATLADGPTVTTLSAGYDAAGNLTTKTDSGGHIGYSYANNTHPNRLSSLSVSGSNPGVGGGSFIYDSAGRIVAGAGYSVSYDRRGLTEEIQHAGHTATLDYAPDGHRYGLTVDGHSTYYLAGGSFRVVTQTNGIVAYRQTISVDGVLIAQRVTRSDASTSFQYFYQDGLGSPVAFANLTGAGLGAVAYGPFGRPRKATTWNTLVGGNPLAAYDTRRGYTGGEQLSTLGVVVLGARVYVPALGRWLSPDPAGIDSPYVYASDNPESDTDPTGEFSLMTGLKLAATAVAVYYTGGAILAGGGSPMLAGAIGGMEAGYINSGGNLEAAGFGEMEGAAMGFIGGAFGSDLSTAQLFEKAGVEGVVAGGFTSLEGGRFSDGFIGRGKGGRYPLWIRRTMISEAW